MTRRGRPKHPDILTPREQDVLALIRAGHSNDEIAEQLGISFTTAKFHVSQIITKLGVRNRRAAARWSPQGDDAAGAGASSEPTGRGVAFAPLAFAHRLGRLLTPAGAVAATAALAVGVGLLAWGVVSTRGDAGANAWVVLQSSSHDKGAAVFLFDLAKRRASTVSVADHVTDAQWLQPGATWLALDLDAPPNQPPATDLTYKVYDTTGNGVWQVPSELTRRAIPVPDGKTVLIERTGNQYIVENVPSGLSGGFLASARGLEFSPDGKRIAYVTVGGNDKENINHDWQSVIEGEKSELTGYGGGGLAIESQREADGLIDLPPNAWSPDSANLLVERDAPCPPPNPDPANCHGTPTFEVYGTEITGKVFWSGSAGMLQSVSWAGPGHLFITYYADAAKDPQFPDARSLIVDLGTQKRAAPGIFQGACCVSFSPDGRHAVVGHGGPAAHDARCSLVDATTGSELAGFDAPPGGGAGLFCGSVSWTPDGSQALVSVGPDH